MDLQELVDGYLEESKIDYVGLWQIAQASKEELGADTPDQVRKFSLEIVKRLYDKGLRPGNYWGGDFDYWPERVARRCSIVSNGNGSRPAKIPISATRSAGSPLAPTREDRTRVLRRPFALHDRDHRQLLFS